MGLDLRLPNITGTTDREQLLQIKSYLYQMAEQLNFAMSSLDTVATSTVERYISNNSLLKKEGGSSSADATTTFNAIKGLIIKSADIVTAYYEEIERKLSSIYVAESDFGTYKQETEQTITSNSDGVTQSFLDVQEITTTLSNTLNTVSSEVNDVDGKIASAKGELEGAISETNETVSGIKTNVDYLLETEAYIKSGYLYTEIRDDGTERKIYGIEIGQTDTSNGEEKFNKFTRFAADKLSFYDQNGNEVAYISDNKLYIRNVEITVSLRIGGLLDTVMDSGDVVTKWVGRG